MRTKKFKKAFTLAEIMLVVIIVGVLAAIAIPNFHRTVARAYAREALSNLILIHAANVAYNSENGNFWPSGSNLDLTAINNNLGLNIIANDVTYECSGDGSSFTCTGTRAGSFTATVTQASLDTTNWVNPNCAEIIPGACP